MNAVLSALCPLLLLPFFACSPFPSPVGPEVGGYFCGSCGKKDLETITLYFWVLFPGPGSKELTLVTPLG